MAPQHRMARGLMNGAQVESMVGRQLTEKGVFTICFNGNPDNGKPPRPHVFTQLDDTNAYRLIEQNPARSVVIIENE